jgi:hypothetical protein
MQAPNVLGGVAMLHETLIESFITPGKNYATWVAGDVA